MNTLSELLSTQDQLFKLLMFKDNIQLLELSTTPITTTITS